MLNTVSNSLLPIMLIVAAVSDVISLRIPNWLTGLTALLFFPLAFATGMPLAEFEVHLLVGVALFVVGFVFFQFGLFGGGDAKLMAAAGLWFGSSSALPFLFMTAVAGGVLAVVVGLWSIFTMHLEIHGRTEDQGSTWKRITALKPNVPYGLAFAVGGIVAFRDTWWMQHFA